MKKPGRGRVNVLSLPLLDREGLFQAFLVRDGELVATLGAAAGQDLAAVGGLHALAETVNRLAAALMRLECTFHDAFCFPCFECGPGEAVQTSNLGPGHHTRNLVKGRRR